MKIHIGPYPKTSKTKRKIKVQINGYDLWNLHHSLALVILPALKLLAKNSGGTAFVKDKDVPKELRNGDVDHCQKKWKYVLDEMGWAFEREVNEDILYPGAFSEEQIKKYNDEVARARNGLLLFAKYYGSLWN